MGNTYEHNGYTLTQKKRYEYYIYKEDKCVCHASCRGWLSEEEAKQRIEWFIKWIG